MSGAAQSQIIGLLMMVFFMGIGLRRRMRPQPVRPGRIAVSGLIIVLLLGSSLAFTGSRILSDTWALLLAPVFLVIGGAVGWYLVRTMKFWTDPGTGALWMQGGVLFALILLGTIALRFGARALLTGNAFSGGYGSNPYSATGYSGPHGFLYDLSADFLFLSLGLWAARAGSLLLRYRGHTAANAPAGIEST
ncbi:MAG: hypothetical protein ACR2MZ_11760 [Candidatus Dormibacter sp.]|uniref:hypothetical protein n=1 Tax=Candidatus Dormibacter sp. TaxID=2973982 RepID=UPI000DB1610A|nr:MAG: hypothetical protein DLM66_03480 [Candidatus Dormibacteraeota bacterium]